MMPTRRCQYSSYCCPFILYSRLLPFLVLKDASGRLDKDRYRHHQPRSVPDAGPRFYIVFRRSDPLMMSSISFGRSLAIRRRRRCQRTHSNIVRRQSRLELNNISTRFPEIPQCDLPKYRIRSWYTFSLVRRIN